MIEVPQIIQHFQFAIQERLIFTRQFILHSIKNCISIQYAKILVILVMIHHITGVKRGCTRRCCAEKRKSPRTRLNKTLAVLSTNCYREKNVGSFWKTVTAMISMIKKKTYISYQDSTDCVSLKKTRVRIRKKPHLRFICLNDEHISSAIEVCVHKLEV